MSRQAFCNTNKHYFILAYIEKSNVDVYNLVVLVFIWYLF